MVKAADFTQVYRAGHRFGVGCVQLHYRSDAACNPRLGMAIAKRVLPRAVDRNRVKRLIRESFRAHQAQLPPMDIVISLRGAKRRGVPPELPQHLSQLWRRLCPQ